MITTEEKKLILEYVNASYYDQDKLIKYLSMHDVVGNEIFAYCDKHTYREDQSTYSNWLDDEHGYMPLSVSDFVKRVPFYFYTRDIETIDLDDNLIKGLEVKSVNNKIEDISFKYTVIPFVPLNPLDKHIELNTDMELYHNLILFSQDNMLWCYVDLFNTFQFYVLLCDSWDESIEHFSSSKRPCTISRQRNAVTINYAYTYAHYFLRLLCRTTSSYPFVYFVNFKFPLSAHFMSRHIFCLNPLKIVSLLTPRYSQISLREYHLFVSSTIITSHA